jgi:hypothetical protein
MNDASPDRPPRHRGTLSGFAVWRRWAGLAALLLVAAASTAYAQISVGRLKGIFVERFTRFVEWPQSALPDGAPFVVCIEGTGDTAENLFEVARSRKFKDRVCEVRRVHAGSDLKGCHLLYVAASEGPHLSDVMAAVSGRPILTVGDASGFADKGVLINLFQEEKLMHFEINLPAVKRSKLTFSSQLLRLGRLVGGPAQEPGH